MDDIEVWRTAHHYIKRYGGEARARAARRADAFLTAGDAHQAQLWQRIAEAIAKQEQEKPDDGA
jgi:hypothetical protein